MWPKTITVGNGRAVIYRLRHRRAKNGVLFAETQLLHILEIGEKSGQQADIKNAKEKVLKIQKQKALKKPSG